MRSLVFALILGMVAPMAASAASAQAVKGKASVAAALDFLSSRQTDFGLIDSYVEDSTDYSYSYDNAMAAMAFISAGDLAAAARILEAFAAIGPEPDGGFLHRYYASDGRAAYGISGVGANTYLLHALNLYRIESGDASFDILAAGIVEYLLAHQDVDGGLFGRAGVTWKSTENNLAAYTAIHSFGAMRGIQPYIDAASAIRAFLLAECWDGTRFLTGKNDPMIVTDVQALGALVLGPAYTNGAYWVENHTLHTQRYEGRRTITGFDLNTDRDTVWTEGTLQQALAFSVAADPARADFYQREAEKLFQSSGAFLQASKVGTTGFGDNFTRWQAAAPTAWFVLVANRDNVLQPLW